MPRAVAPGAASADANLLSFGFNQPLTPQRRIELTKLSEVYCREVLDKVPGNTPAEDAWVMPESKSTDVPRLRRLMSEQMGKHYTRHVESEINIKRAFSRLQDKS